MSTTAHGGRRRRPYGRAPQLAKPARVDLPKQLPVDAMLTAVANVPSREGMAPPRDDYANNLARCWSKLWNQARGRRSAAIDTTWDQLAVAFGYEPGAKMRGAVERYLKVWAEAGLLTYGGVKDASGRWRRLDICLLDPPALTSDAASARSSAGSSVGSAAPRFVCKASRRRETASERAARRRQPWRRNGGRRDAEPTHVLFWGSELCAPFGAPGGSALRGLPPGATNKHDAHAEGSGLTRPPSPGSSSAAAALDLATAAGKGGGLETVRRAAAEMPADVIALAAWSLLFDGHPRLAERKRRQLLNVCGMADRCSARPGAGAVWLVDSMADYRAALDVQGTAANGIMRAIDAAAGPPSSLAFFLPALRRTARKWRQNWRAHNGRADRHGRSAIRVGREEWEPYAAATDDYAP